MSGVIYDSSVRQVEMLIPLKQGLKPRLEKANAELQAVEMLIPLKQGLKHMNGIKYIEGKLESKC